MVKNVKRKIVKSSNKKPVNRKSGNAQVDRVFEYLLKAGHKGATNFEMMINLRICDVRKRISDLNQLLYEYFIDSEYEESSDGKRYKRYWAVPIGMTLWEFLNETKRTRKATRKSTGGGRR